MKIKRVILGVVLALAGCMTGCGVSQIALIDAVATAADAVLTAVPNLSAPVKLAVGEALAASACAANEFGSTDSAAVKSQKIIACYSPIQWPVSATDQAIIQAIESAVQNVIAVFAVQPASAVKGANMQTALAHTRNHISEVQAKLPK